MITRLIVLFAVVLFGIAVFPFITEIDPVEEIPPTSQEYLDYTSAEIGTANIVTAVVASYRGFDTLGEIAVLLAASAGVGILLKNLSTMRSKIKEASEIVKTGAGVLFSMLLLFGVYIFLHGHLTPGGGFQGGVVIASAVALLFVAGISEKVNDFFLRFIESISGLAYVAVGVFGIVLTGSFLNTRILPVGEIGRLLSGGAVAVIYCLIGLKVGAELTGIIEKLKGRENEHEIKGDGK